MDTKPNKLHHVIRTLMQTNKRLKEELKQLRAKYESTSHS